MATVEDIVKVSGVSRSTVFRFLNGSNVRADAKKAIIRAMEALNYKNGSIYRQQRVVVEISTSHSFESFKGFSEVVQGITQRADEQGIEVRLARRTGDQIVSDYNRWKQGEERKGVIIIGKEIEEEEKEAEVLLKGRIPHIFVNRVMEQPGISYVAVDLRKAACEVVEYLLKNNRRKIAVWGDGARLRVDRDKLQGYQDAFLKNDIKVPEECYFETDRHGDWETAVKGLLEKGCIPDAYFGICDSYAMKFIHLARGMGYKVPEDIAVVGMDDVETGEYFRPALTTVHIPFKKMGMKAVDHLLEQIFDDEVSSIKTIIQHKLVVRESSI